jgi:hypothetical protein
MCSKNLVGGCCNEKTANDQNAMQTVAAAFYINQAQALTYVNMESHTHPTKSLISGTP